MKNETKITTELRNAPGFEANGTRIPANKHNSIQGKHIQKHTGNENVFKGSNSTLIHPVGKVLKSFSHKAGLNKYI